MYISHSCVGWWIDVDQAPSHHPNQQYFALIGVLNMMHVIKQVDVGMNMMKNKEINRPWLKYNHFCRWPGCIRKLNFRSVLGYPQFYLFHYVEMPQKLISFVSGQDISACQILGLPPMYYHENARKPQIGCTKTKAKKLQFTRWSWLVHYWFLPQNESFLQISSNLNENSRRYCPIKCDRQIDWQNKETVRCSGFHLRAISKQVSKPLFSIIRLELKLHTTGTFARQQWVKSLWPSDTIWGQRSGIALAQVMPCCLMAPSHCLN